MRGRQCQLTRWHGARGMTLRISFAMRCALSPSVGRKVLAEPNARARHRGARTHLAAVDLSDRDIDLILSVSLFRLLHRVQTRPDLLVTLPED